MASAAARGQLLLLNISSQTTRPIMMFSAPPSSDGMTNSPTQGMNTSIETLMIGRVMWDEFFSNNDWPMASTVAVVMVVLILVPLAIFNHYQAQAQEVRR